MKCKFCDGDMKNKDTKTYSVGEVNPNSQISQTYECAKCKCIKKVDMYINKDNEIVDSKETYFVNNVVY